MASRSGAVPTPCVPWKFFRSVSPDDRKRPPQELCRALTDSIDMLGSRTMEAEDGLHVTACERATCTEGVQTCLQAVLRSLEAAKKENVAGLVSPQQQEAQEIVLLLLAADLPARLVMCIEALDFEARKDAMRLFRTILTLGPLLDTKGQVVEYVQNHPQILQLLLEGASRPEVFSHCENMLRSCTTYPQLVAHFHERSVGSRLIELAHDQCFDISSEAFSSLRELLLAQKTVTATYLQTHSEDFFVQYNTLLQASDYVTQRQALRLLGEVLLDRTFMQVMVAYVGSEQFLQIHMNLLRDPSKAIVLEAFHVFKIFVANPHKPQRVQNILCRNRDRLVQRLEALGAERESDKSLSQDLRTVIGVLQTITPPETSSAAPNPSQENAAAAAAVTV